MENDHDVQAQLAEAERLATVAWTEAEDMPLWMYPVVGIWFSGVCACLRFIWESTWWAIPLIALIALEGAFIGWITSVRKANPNLRRMPREFRKSLYGYLVGLMVVLGTTMFLLDRSVIGGIVFCAVASTIGLLVYRWHWYRAADATRRRVAST